MPVVVAVLAVVAEQVDMGVSFELLLIDVCCWWVVGVLLLLLFTWILSLLFFGVSVADNADEAAAPVSNVVEVSSFAMIVLW